MKNFKYIFFTALLAICAFSVTTYTSCKGDKCKDVECRNGGTCSDGNCTCASGYKGEFCQTPAEFCDLNQCQNGGTCAGGACNCPSGYEGTVCETETRAKFIGNYTCLDKVTGSPQIFQYTAQIIAGDQLSQIKILNFGNGQFAQPVIATVTGNSINVPLQYPDGNGKSVQANATTNLLDGSIEWVYQIKTAANVTTNFDGVWGN